MKLAFWRRNNNQTLTVLQRQLVPTPTIVVGESQGELITNKAMFTFNPRG